jgi:hypothetical protein
MIKQILTPRTSYIIPVVLDKSDFSTLIISQEGHHITPLTISPEAMPSYLIAGASRGIGVRISTLMFAHVI